MVETGEQFVWVVALCYGCEGYSEPLHVFATEELAKACLETEAMRRDGEIFKLPLVTARAKTGAGE